VRTDDRPDLTAYARAALSAGCPPDQLRNFAAARIVLQPRQLAASAAARLCDADDGPTEVGYGGARGGGKSHWGLAQIFCDDCARYPGLKFLYLRKVGKAGKEAVQDLRRDVLHSTPHEYKQQEGLLIRKDNGSKVVLGHFQNDRDIDNYLGLQYDGALIEEATQLTARKVRDVTTCVRSSKPGWRPRVYLTTNPGNVGHAWFKSRFVAPFRLGNETDTRFIPATVRDNAHVNAGYRATLEALSGWQRKAWLDGDWDCAAGQFFTTFHREIHVRDRVEIQPGWRVWLGLDYGFTHFTSVHLAALDGDGTLYVVDEHAERRWLPSRHAEAVFAMLKRNGVAPYRVETIAAGHDVFSPNQNGGTVADDYAAHGLRLSPANVDRINGAAELLRRLGDCEANPPLPPRIVIDSRCARLIDCLPALQHDPHRPEDVDKVDCGDDGLGGDDFYDSLRYSIMHAAAKPRAFTFGADPFGEEVRW
jgi:phage terminase large subunit